MSILEDVAALSESDREGVERSATVMLALTFSDQARTMCDEAERDLVAAHARADRAAEYLRRTTATLEQAVQLYVMGRT